MGDMIVDFSDIKNIRHIADNVNDEKRLYPYMVETENIWIIPAIGIELCQEIEKDKCKYSELLNGGVYDKTNCETGKGYFEGLKQAVAYLAYSRFVRNHDVFVTASGIKQKMGEYSEPASEASIKRIANESEKIGKQYLNNCIDYLKAKGYIDSCCSKRKNTSKFKVIGR